MAEEKWFIKTKGADFRAWARELKVDPVIARIIRNRDVLTLEEARAFLSGGVSNCHSPWLLKDMERAVECLKASVRAGKKIRVIGDYDVDGICSSYILRKGLGCLTDQVDVAIPHRIYDGYGLNEHLIREAAEDGMELIITCDNGISAKSQVELAEQLGIEVIVTDHHEVPFEMVGEERREILPPALAVVDPKREDDDYPFSGICGAVVAYKAMQALAEKLGEEPGADALRRQLDEFLEFAAFATVCDVMELKDENRILVREGIRRIRQTKNPGLMALTDVCGIDRRGISAYHFGFVLGPCLNASGRLDTAKRALELLCCNDYEEAVPIARELKDLNDSRKNLTAEGVEDAVRFLQEKGREGDKVLVIYLPHVHESLAGIIAGRIKEKYNRPTFVITRGEEGVKGSGRSIEQYHMYEALVAVRSLLTKFGGHRMAAGFSLEEEKIEAFREALNDNCRLTEEDFLPRVSIDMELPISYPTAELVKQLELLEPFGIGNTRPLFVQRDLTFYSGKKMGKEGRFGRFEVGITGSPSQSMVFFGDMDAFLQDWEQKFGAGSGERLLRGQEPHTLHAVYQIALNEYRGRQEVQLQLKHYK